MDQFSILSLISSFLGAGSQTGTISEIRGDEITFECNDLNESLYEKVSTGEANAKYIQELFAKKANLRFLLIRKL